LAPALVALQLAAIVALSVYTIFRFPIFDGVDEGAHVAYIAEVAEHGRIPWVGRDTVPWQVLAIQQRVYPRRSPLDPRRIGLAGSSYEGWQPPLYYVLAAPAFLIPSEYLNKVRAIRAFDLVLLLAAIGLLARLAREVFQAKWMLPFALALSVLLWPGVIVRAITVSNEALELALVCLFLLAAWRATADPAPRRMLAVGVCWALCILTQLSLVSLAPLLIAPLVTLGRRRPPPRAIVQGLGALVLPTGLLVPWLTMNLSRYHALVASSAAERLTATNFPPGPRSGLGALRSGVGRLGHALLPQEWWPEYRGVFGAALVALAAVPLLGLAIAARRPSVLRSRAAVILAAPLPLCLVVLAVVLLRDSWPPALFPRYLNPMLAPFMLFAAWALMQASPLLAGRSITALAGASTLAIGSVWAYMALAHYSTRLGASVGIHANAPP
jgi:4-amino-4-deoxy-L-arabinose transferase-like glycosyltransferase